jgi:hypothetical protein
MACGAANLIICLLYLWGNPKNTNDSIPNKSIRGSKLRATNHKGEGSQKKSIAAYRTRYHEAKGRVRVSKVRRKEVHNFVQLFLLRHDRVLKP